uniref:Desmoplakin b n=1 Tax=Cyprinus carpio carpio TaxID=630221 RepID=A0A8C1E0C2_CYPCA
MSSWGDDLTVIEQQIANHNGFHSSIQRSAEVDRARTELLRGKDQNAELTKSCLNKLEQEWDSLQKASYQRSVQLQELRNIIEEIFGQIMWVNDREEEELVFDWGDKNIDVYIPQKQESFSKLMSELEQKEIQLNVLKSKVDNLLRNNHPASDKIQAYMETLQTQWSWLLQITKCINVHLKENARYSQFYKEAREMNNKLQKEHDNIRKNFSCDKSTALHNLLELQQGLERERERLTEQREMVQQLVLKSKSIVRLKPRNPDEKVTGQNILVQALCDFRQDEKTIRKGDEGILKDNSERTTWQVTGPGGMDMQVPAVCLLVPPPNPLAVSLANKNSQYYEAILTVWNQLYINVKSMISWQYCLLDINRINSLTINMLSKMSPEEYNSIMRSLEMHFQEFKKHSQGSELFGAEDHKLMESQFTGATQHYSKLVVDLPAYGQCAPCCEIHLLNITLHSRPPCFRLNSLKSLLKDLLKAEDVVKVYEARLTEKETASLDPNEVQKYHQVLKVIIDLEQKQDLLNSLLVDLNKIQQYNEQMDQGRYRCIINLSQYAEHVNQLSDRWKRIHTQINNRSDAPSPTERLLFRLELLETVQKDGETCINAIKNYELELAVYSAGLETLLNIPIKRTVLQSPSSSISEEASSLNAHYLELLTRSSDYYKLLMASQKNMEELKTSSVIQTSQYQCNSLQQERDDFLKKMATMEQEMMRLKKLEDELSRIKLSLESELRLKSQLQEDNERIKKDFTQWKTKCATHEELIRKHNSERSGLESQFNSVNAEMERLRTQLKETEERYRLLSQNLERERAEMQALRDSQQKELLRPQRKPDGATKYTQTDLMDASSLVFEGVRKKVTAQQLHDCGVIDKVTFEQLMTGQRTVEDVSVDIRLNLKGTGAIAGLAAGPKGKMTFTEAKKQKLISDESGNMLLEAQAATGYIIDPRANVRMTVEAACLNGLVDEADKKRLLTAEAACVGFRDPKTGKLLPVSQAMKKGIVNQEIALRLLQAQEAAGGILDPILSVYVSKDTAMDRDLVDEDLYQALNARPDCYIDPDTGLRARYVTLKKRCKADLSTSLLLLPAPEKPMTVQGLRHEVSVSDLVDAKLLQPSDVDHLREGKITSQDIEHRLRAYLRGSTCIAGIYDEANDCALPIYQAMKEGLLRPGTTLELLEAQAASGFIIDPIHNEYHTVEEACKKGLVGVEFKEKLLSAERAVTGYKDPGTNNMISLFEAIERGLIEKGHGIRLLEAQIASGGIIDPKHSHRIDVDVAYQRSYFDEEMNQILKDEGDDTKGFFDPNTEDNLTYLQLKSRCIPDKKTGLVLLPLYDKKKMQQKNSTRKRRVLIVDPESNKEMTVREAYEKKLIDYETFLELSQQECEWEEIVIIAPDGSTSTAIMDMQTGIQYDLKELLAKGVIDQVVFDKYHSGNLTITELAYMITNKTKTLSKPLRSSVASSSFASQTTMKSHIIKTETVKSVESVSTRETIQDPSSTNTAKHISSMSIKLTPLVETIEEQNPVGAVFDTEKLEKISICDALKRGIIDSITAQRLLEAQACTGGIVSPENGRRISIQEATRLGVLDDEMANRIKPAQKAYIGFEDVKTKRKMSAAEAVKEKWLPYEAGQRFLEFQYLTGGLFDPELGCRRSLEEALQLGWLDMRAAQKLQDTRHHPKTLTCPKTKLRISYKEALEGCMTEENTGVRMLPASTVSSRGISSPYNLSNPGSASGSRSGSRRGSVDYSLSPTSSSKYSSFSYSKTSFSSRSLS